MKVVIPAAGLGTRLLPITKELPKEMLPLFFKGRNGSICLKPVLQAVFEQLYDAGLREFCFIVGRGKRSIEDHFTPDEDFVEYLRTSKKAELANELQEFYKKIANSKIIFMSQPKPKGFGDAVYRAKLFTENDPFLVHAGDDLVLSPGNNHLKRMTTVFERYNADVTFLVERVEDPRRYGVVTGNRINHNLIEVKKVLEKPKKPPSNLAAIALYLFKPIIYKAIEKIEHDEKQEIQLADALQLLIDWQYKLYALELRPDERRIDVGTPETYLHILRTPLENG